MWNILWGSNSEPPQGNKSAFPPPPDKIFNVSGTKFSYGDIQKYTNICFKSTLRMQFLGFKKWCSANYSDTKQKNVCWGICKLGKVFGCVSRAYYFKCQVSWIELRKMSEVFRAKLLCKLSVLFVSFSWVSDFVLENLKLKKILVNVHWSVWQI